MFFGLPKATRESNIVEGFGLPDDEITDFGSTYQVVGRRDMRHHIFTCGCNNTRRRKLIEVILNLILAHFSVVNEASFIYLWMCHILT